MSTTREMILKAWHTSRRWADTDPFVVKLTAAAFAGYALETAGGDVVAARALVPIELESYWGRVHGALDQVAEEEVAPRAAAGVRR